MNKARIMVVEDEGLVALQIKDALVNLGYEVPLVALSGEEAVRKIMTHEPDLVLMDIQLKGGISGIEASKRIAARLDVPVIYLTAFSDPETLEQAQVTEPYGYLVKPFDERALHASIQTSLFRHQRARGEKQSRWLLSAATMSLRECILITDAKGYVKFANPSAERLFAKPQADLLDKRLPDIVTLTDAETRSPLRIQVSEPLLAGKSVATENCRLVLPDGRTVAADLTSSPVRDEKGTLFGLLHVFRESAWRDQMHTRLTTELSQLSAMREGLLPPRDARTGGLRCEWLHRSVLLGGGEILGFFSLDPGHTAFYSADVIGQCTVSAVFALLLHWILSPDIDRGGMLTEEAPGGGRRLTRQPQEVVKELNRRFFLKDEACPHFTIAYGIIDNATGIASIVRAGHPFLLLHRADGKVQTLKPDGYAIGLFPTSEGAVEQVRLDKGDRLFLFSDGLIDCTSPSGERFSFARLSAFLASRRGTPLAQAVRELDEELTKWHGSGTFNDDASLLAIERE